MLVAIQNMTAAEALANLEPYDNTNANTTSHMFIDIEDGFTLKGIFFDDGEPNDKKIVSLGTGGVNVKRFVALITQAGGAIPTAEILVNTLSDVPVLARTGAGSYTLTLAGEFTVDKSAVVIGAPKFVPASIVRAVLAASFNGSTDVLTFSSIDLEEANAGVEEEWTSTVMNNTVEE